MKSIQIILIMIVLISASAIATDYSTENYEKIISGKTTIMKLLNYEPGDQISIIASGKIKFADDSIEVGPDGINMPPSSGSWPCPESTGISLYGRFNTFNGKCFKIGQKYSYIANSSGSLLVGVNDDYMGGNSGSWKIFVTIQKPINSTNITKTKNDAVNQKKEEIIITPVNNSIKPIIKNDSNNTPIIDNSKVQKQDIRPPLKKEEKITPQNKEDDITVLIILIMLAVISFIVYKYKKSTTINLKIPKEKTSTSKKKKIKTYKLD